jgi:sporulation protein YlmC with PRC-barrel domain
VQVTKGGAIDYDDAGNPLSQGGAEAPGYVPQATEALASAASSASEAARGAFDQGKSYVGQAADRYPDDQHALREGTRAVQRQATENPIMTLLMTGAIGYALAWMIHGGQGASRQRMRSGAGARRDLPGQRTGKPLIESDRVEGTAVHDVQGNRIGTVKRLMIEKVEGRVAYAVLSFGGFMGFGREEYAIPWRKLDYDTSLEGYRTDITEEQLRSAPRFTYDRDEDWSDRSREQALHDHYRVTAYWIVP